ncbi:MAG TPA: threonine/serine dehydratase [Woeseiaceae bacterium]|nr:threonine/serine dehydratase [Woeseiaceae bacterium]
MLREQLRGEIVCTPTIRCAGLEDQLGGSMRIYGKLEFLQRTGTFKARGALATVRSLSEEQRKAGVTAVSAGNHAIATAYAARISGTTAKVVMTASANPYRVAASRGYGAEVVIVNDVHEAFRVADKIQTDEGRYFVHPFEGRQVALGTGTIGLELAEQIEAPDAILIAVGGGGLIGGLGNAIKQLWPRTEVIGVEPEGADSMSRSLAAGKPEAIDAVRTIADSLGAPYACPWSFKLCQDNIDRMVLVSDEQLRGAMGLLFQHMKIAVEPACAATTAALLGPLAESLAGRRVLLVFCGSNIDWATFRSQVRD